MLKSDNLAIKGVPCRKGKGNLATYSYKIKPYKQKCLNGLTR